MQSQTVDYLEGLLEGFVAYDENWVLTYINAAGERLLGRRREDVLGNTWHQAFPHAVGNPVDAMYQRVMRTRQPERMEYNYAHYGRWFEISASPVRSGGVAVYFRDISDREALNRIGRALTAELDLERVVQAVTDAATEVSGAQFGAFFYNQKNEAGESYMLYTLSGVERAAFSKFPMPRNTAVFEKTFKGEGVLRSPDITRDPRYGKTAPHHGMPQGHLPVKSYLAVPVISRSGEVLGGLFFGHPQPGVFTERAERLVAGIASQAAIAIDNARLYGAIQAELRDSKLLHEVSAALIREDDVEVLYERIVDAAVSIMGSDFASMQMLHPERGAAGELRLLAFRGFSPEAAEFWQWVRADSESACGAALRTGRRVIAADVEKCDFMAGTQDLATCRQTGIRAVQTTPLVSRSGKLVGMISTHWRGRHEPSDRDLRLLDILARQAADLIERTQATHALREADRRKDEFLAMLAHELRNPLAPIRNGLHLLRVSKPGSDAAEDARAMMERQLNHLIRLVDDLLEVSRVSRGKIELRRAPVEIAHAVASAIETSRPVLDAARHRLDVNVPSAALTVDADLVRLSQIIANLLNNAAKYSDPGGRIALGVRRENGEAVISVRDNGIGIPAELLPHIFDMFAQADRARTQGGLGIGLSLAQRLTELHGGRIEAKSDGPGQGSEFVVRLPLARG